MRAADPFPFDELEPLRFVARAAWTLEQVVGYIGTWSSVQRLRAATGRDLAAATRTGWRCGRFS